MTKEDFEIIPKLERGRLPVLPIVLSADDHYAAPCGVVIASLLKNASPGFFYDVVVLDNGLSEVSRQRLRDLAAGMENAAVRFCDVTHIAADAPVHSQFSKAAYLFLFIPWLFRGHEKALYLDCDMIVRRDVAELFETRFNNEYLAAVRDIGIARLAQSGLKMQFKGRRIPWSRYIRKHLGFTKETAVNAFNSGLALFNIPAFEADDFSALRDLERHIGFGYYLVDQCVANILFKGRVLHLPQRWNFQVLRDDPEGVNDWLLNEYSEAAKDPAVIHYITQFKPWRKFSVRHEEEFWSVARQTVWHHELHERRLTESFMRWLNVSRVRPCPSCSDTPQFSIIMPVFNRGKLLERSIRSVQLQDFSDFELIVVDDASTDDTVQVIRRLAKTDARIKRIELKTNRGPGVARNIGIEQARGKYVGICDSDDYLIPGALSAFARRVSGEEIDAVSGNQLRWVGETRTVIYDPGPAIINRDARSGDLNELPELWMMVHFHRCIFRREFLLQNGIEYPALRRVEDPVYMADVVTKARSFALIDDPIYMFNSRHRVYHFTYEEIHDAYLGYELIRTKLTEAGYRNMAFLFHFFYSPFWLDYSSVSEEDALKLAAQLVDLMSHIPMEELNHPMLKHPSFDPMSCHHDLLVVKNSTPEMVARLMRRKLFCGAAHLWTDEIKRLKKEKRALNHTLSRIRFILRVWRFFARRFVRLQKEVQRAVRHRRAARHPE
jgi:lipopolysaccharide biosynthesis glycosyltransferase/glycosyltransferase involved in cell wall biosynthesis